MVIQFYRSFRNTYAAKLIVKKTNDRIANGMIVLKELKFIDRVYSRNNGQWLNCKVMLENEFTLKITGRKGFYKRTQEWHRADQAYQVM